MTMGKRSAAGKHRISIAWAVVVLTLVIAGLGVFVWARSCAYTVLYGDAGKHIAYKKVDVGNNMERVRDLLGPPQDSGPKFHLSQEGGFEEEYRRARSLGAQEWWFYHNGIDTTCAIGFDAEGKVVGKFLGGT